MANLLKIEYQKTEENQPKKQGNAFHYTFPLKKTSRGSLTVEAAIVTPLVILLFLALTQLFGAIIVQTRLQSAMSDIGRRLSYYYYAVEEVRDEEERTLLSEAAEGVLFLAASETVVKGLVLEELGDAKGLDLLVQGGRNGISFAESGYDSGRGEIDVIANYKIRFPLLLLPSAGISVRQGSAHRAWIGRVSVAETEESIVYITENSQVYHTHLSCGSLSLSVKEISFQNAENARNASGGKYYACELCGSGSDSKVYVTSYGDRYHLNRNCSGLKRTVSSIPVSAIGGRSLCRRCAGRSRA